MSSNDSTSYKTSEPILCATGCGFFGSASTNNLCSKCYRDVLVQEQQAASAKAAVDNLVDTFTFKQRIVEPVELPKVNDGGVKAADLKETKAANRCMSCRKKVGVLGFQCKCLNTYCGVHRYPEKHDCDFDFKSVGKAAIARANPVVKAEKLDKC